MRTLIVALELARIIAGEAPGCPIDAKLAVAHVASRNSVWFGDADPALVDLLVALKWQDWPDPTGHAVYLIGPGDARKMPFLGPKTGNWQCKGTFLEAHRARETVNEDGK